ncbi:MAG: TPM domain-containing protein, partial [Eubacteriales bacterium]|nr:TPM domain-containing protein [Eubacteriales bacterium]
MNRNKKILALLLSLGIIGIYLCTAVVEVWAKSPHVVDDGNLISAEVEAELESRMEEISEEYQMDVVLVTTDSLYGKTAEAYADDYFDENGYGYGASYDGILFLISMEDRDWAISTTGR